MKKMVENINPNTIQSTCFLLTIPQILSEMTKLKIEELLLKNECDLKQYVISLETHTKDVNKGTHLHIWMRFKKQKEFGLNHFDYFGKHGNLQKVLSSENVISYICKEDMSPLANFDVVQYCLKRDFQGTVLKLVFDFKQNWADIVSKYSSAVSKKPWYTMKKFIDEKYRADEICAQGKLERIRYIDRSLIEKRLNSEELDLFDSFEGYQQLVDIINKCTTLGFNQKHKDCTVSIVGDPNIGKTWVFSQLGSYLPMYKYPEDGWHREYLNEVYSFLVWHEWDYKIHSPEDYLRLFEGIGTDLKIKGSKGSKRDRPMFFLTSNESWELKVDERFKRNQPKALLQKRALKVRIKEIDFQSRDITFVTKLFVRISEDI